MSVRFDETSDSGNGDWIKADGSVAPSTGEFAFSVSLWVYFEADISSTETIWFYGDKDQPDRFLVLEAVDDSGSRKLRARMSNDSGVGPTTTNSVAVSNDAWHLVTVTATKDGDDVVDLTLYLGDNDAETGSQTVATTNEGNYNRFAIGRFAGSSSANPGSFLAEQSAIWDSELDSDDHNTMFADDLNGEDVRRPPWSVTSNPGIGYWILAGHRRHALRLHDASQNTPNEGDLNNEAPGKPDMALAGR